MKHCYKQFVAFAVILAPNIFFSQTNTYTFSNCGATGRLGPTQSQVSAAYASGNLNGLVGTTSPTSGIQTFTIPNGIVAIRIEAWGAEGGPVGANAGGRGARMRGDFTVTAGQVLHVVVGQMGLSQATNNCNGGGGGGASFVYFSGAPQPLIAAGGGGGGHYFIGPGLDGTVSALASTSPSSSGTPGNNGNGGGAGMCGSGWPGAGGGGWATAGANTCTWSGQVTEGGRSQFSWQGGRRNSATVAGSQGQDGSFGGGGAAFHGAGGGGGYSGGGGGGSCFTNEMPLAGGGGSYNGGTNQNNSAGVGSGHGKIIISTFSAVSPVAVNIIQTGNISCYGYANGALTASPSGGTPPYTYTWMPGSNTSSAISAIPAGVYTVTVKDANNFSTTATYNLTQPADIAISSTVANIACNGGSNGSATVQPSGGTSPYSYSWLPSGGNSSVAVNLNAGTYTANITDANGCSKPKVIAISQAPSIAASGGGTICSGLSTTLTASGAASYSWSNGSTGQSIVVSPTSSTVYTVTGTGCVSGTTVGVTVVYCAGSPALASIENKLRLFPNPNRGEFEIVSSNDAIYKVEIYDLSGKLILSEKYSLQKVKINISSFSEGLYIAKIEYGERTEFIKVVKE